MSLQERDRQSAPHGTPLATPPSGLTFGAFTSFREDLMDFLLRHRSCLVFPSTQA